MDIFKKCTLRNRLYDRMLVKSVCY